MEWAREHSVKGSIGVLLYLYVQPGASKSGFKGVFGENPVRLKLSVQAPPVDGAANEAVIEFLSKTLKISKSKIHLLSGETSRSKSVWVEGIFLSTVAKWV